MQLAGYRERQFSAYSAPAGETFASYALTTDDNLPDKPLPESFVKSAAPYPEAAPPVFFGHYWLRAERPERLATNVACVDYSVAKGGMLCSYRWDGESELDNEKFVSVRSKASGQTCRGTRTKPASCDDSSR